MFFIYNSCVDVPAAELDCYPDSGIDIPDKRIGYPVGESPSDSQRQYNISKPGCCHQETLFIRSTLQNSTLQ